MNELYELKEKLCRELKKYNNENINTSNLEIIDKLSHAVKNMDKIIQSYEEEENASYGYNSYEASYMNNSRGRGRNSNNSYARGRGRNARRDNMGRYSNEGYSRNNDNVAQLREMMMDAPTDEIRRDYERVIASLESNM
jgi:hypothetical protein